MSGTKEPSEIYDHRAIEPRWQSRWLKERTFAAKSDRSLPKSYILDMFPYPSGAGLHVGHPLGYTATDIVARYRRHRGFNVLHPMGWDAFGLPAEQYALKTGIHPAITTAENVATFRRQLQAIGLSYDWDRELNTTDPAYYRWTQWIFLKLFERGLVYQAEVPVNWCPAMGTVLANEEVIEGKSEVGGHPVVRRPMKQWMLRITAYADRLLAGLDGLDWPESIKALQRNWIGRSEGAEVDFPVDLGLRENSMPSAEAPPGSEGNNGLVLRVFTTRPDTLFGATYMVIAPEHPLFGRIVVPERAAECEAYREAAAAKSDMERSALQREKSGVFTGRHAVNPVNLERIPIWVADYVMMGYGTGAIMAVPGHDERDFEFASRHGLPVKRVVEGGELPHAGEGRLVNSGILDGLSVEEAQGRIADWLEQRGAGRRAVHTKLRDWLFSRQRYWGEPVPLLHLPDGSVRPLSEQDLPLTLPQVERYQPSGTGESPLSLVESWVDAGGSARRETHTMPQWAGSCWYYLRFIDPHNEQRLVDPELERYWMPVDLYVGGAEHAVLHLLYARFWHKVLYDIGVVSTEEPFARLVNQGMILGEDHEKMSKSRGNTVGADEIIGEYGADAFRLYEMFLGPLSATKPWQTAGMAGTHRFLQRLWRCCQEPSEEAASEELARAFHATLAKVGEDIEALSFHTAIAAMMEYVNVLTRSGTGMPRELLHDTLVMLEPFAPHMAEELNERMGGRELLAWQPWPQADEKLLTKDQVVVPVQINGKVRARIRVKAGLSEAHLEQAARADPAVARLLEDMLVKKVVSVHDRIVNFIGTPKG